MTDVKAAKKKKLESIKYFLEQHTNYRIETINDGLCICFPYRYWTDGDGMSLYLILDDDMNKMYLEDDDLCIHNTLCMIPDDENAKNAVRSLAKSFQILCIYEDSYNASPVFRQGLRPLSFYQKDRQDFLIEAFLKSKSSSYTIETKNYRLDISKKNIELTDSCEYIPLEKIIITVRDATFVTRRKELEKTQKKNSTVCQNINKKGE